MGDLKETFENMEERRTVDTDIQGDRDKAKADISAQEQHVRNAAAGKEPPGSGKDAPATRGGSE